MPASLNVIQAATPEAPEDSAQTAPKRAALGMALSDWQDWFKEQKLPRYVAAQVYQWIFQKGVLDPQQFSNVGRAVRERLADEFHWQLPKVDSHLVSKDTSEKYLLETDDGLLFEMVLMPYENRATLCVSSQVGCKRGCTFCQTGKIGLKRNLTAGEILSQLHIANAAMRAANQKRVVTNLVFMGMGEPLDNYDEVVKACSIMIDPEAYGLSKHKVTVSTSGLVPEIRQLGKDLPVRLAISLHNADDAKRSAMMPVNRIYPLAKLKEALIDYPAPKRYGITFEYVMIEGDNDSIQDAKNLVRFLKGIKSKVNLIPINHFPGIEMRASEAASLHRFQDYLVERNVPTSIRYSRGQDISGGCGQLATKRHDELHLDPRQVQKERRQAQRRRAFSPVFPSASA